MLNKSGETGCFSSDPSESRAWESTPYVRWKPNMEEWQIKGNEASKMITRNKTKQNNQTNKKKQNKDNVLQWPTKRPRRLVIRCVSLISGVIPEKENYMSESCPEGRERERRI